MGILVLNAGSSSLKYAFFEGAEGTCSGSGTIDLDPDVLDYEAGAGKVLDQFSGKHIDKIAHRVVHGGRDFKEAVILDEGILKQLGALNSIAPLHNPPALKVIECAAGICPGVDQIAVFDTGFFADLPDRSAVFPLPYEWFENRMIRRYGFHGISHQYCSEHASRLNVLPEGESRLIVCHLGNGCSISAIRDGRPVDTTMGFTPMDGVVMGTRPGSVDPGILFHLLRSGQFDVGELDELLNRKSGLLGISGVASDLREIHAAATSGSERAQLAIEIFADSIRGTIASYAVNMGGVDAVVFTGGIGEHSDWMRERICDGLELLGCELDVTANRTGGGDDYRISASHSSVEMWVMKAREELQIVREVSRLF